ncbi:unnamed protein product [Durusdinium trenchii]|uniref:J domain-containing protein n=1 Tax=Durusdinium trenchii TaxID=1381693 RepID=A0ABP0I098_9DINO
MPILAELVHWSAPNAEQNFQRVRDAYEVLSDDSRRREYDRQLTPQSGPRVTRTHYYRWQPGGMPRTQGGFTNEEAARARQEHEELRRRAEAQFFVQFNQYRYRRSLSESLFRFLPLFLPVWTVLMLYSFYRRSKNIEQGSPAESLLFDQEGKAFARDAYGRLHRMPDLDRQR